MPDTRRCPATEPWAVRGRAALGRAGSGGWARVLGSLSTGDVQNLTVSALLMKLMKTGGAHAGQLRQLLDKAGELGLADTPLAAVNGSARG
ncbi:hypothetical protein GCM10009787_29410 [Streptomyces bangladeshensis]|uniref:Uncharacterized protein n=1 Tax=Streptomyces bangladeshensis TaxID=295352 RepID=A0ABN3BHW6_9ACTN